MTLDELYPSIDTVITWSPGDNSNEWGVTNPVPRRSTVMSAPVTFEEITTLPFVAVGVTGVGLSRGVSCGFAGWLVLASGWLVDGFVEFGASTEGVIVDVLETGATGRSLGGTLGSLVCCWGR